jgi:hypothetical protein
VEQALAKGELHLRVIESAPKEGIAVKEALRAIVKGLEPAKVTSTELNSFKTTISNIDKSVVAKLPELKSAIEFLKPMETIVKGGSSAAGATELKKAVEASGLFLESKIAKAAMKGAGAASEGGANKEIRRMIDIITKGDFKGSLLKLKESLNRVETVEILKAAKIKPEELGARVEKLIKSTEFFQAKSMLTDTLDIFVPFFWKSLRDGELVFSESYKGASEGKSYSCTINLDLESSGRVSAIVLLMFDKVHVSFVAENTDFIKLIEDNSDELKGQFAELGLPLGSIRASREENLDFKSPPVPIEEGFNIKA